MRVGGTPDRRSTGRERRRRTACDRFTPRTELLGALQLVHAEGRGDVSHVVLESGRNDYGDHDGLFEV
jgi:hypothetical protein